MYLWWTFHVPRGTVPMMTRGQKAPLPAQPWWRSRYATACSRAPPEPAGSGRAPARERSRNYPDLRGPGAKPRPPKEDGPPARLQPAPHARRYRAGATPSSALSGSTTPPASATTDPGAKLHTYGPGHLALPARSRAPPGCGTPRLRNHLTTAHGAGAHLDRPGAWRPPPAYEWSKLAAT